MQSIYIPAVATKFSQPIILTIKYEFKMIYNGDVPTQYLGSYFILNDVKYLLTTDSAELVISYVLTTQDIDSGYIVYATEYNNVCTNTHAVITDLLVDFSKLVDSPLNEATNTYNSISYFDSVIYQKFNAISQDSLYKRTISFDSHPQMLKSIVRIKYKTPGSSIHPESSTLFYPNSYYYNKNLGTFYAADPFFLRTNQTDQDSILSLTINGVVYYYKIGNDIIYNAIQSDYELIFECDSDQVQFEFVGDSVFLIDDVDRMVILGNKQDYQNITRIPNDKTYITQQNNQIYKFGYIKKSFVELNYAKLLTNDIYKIYINNSYKKLLTNQSNESRNQRKLIEFDTVENGAYVPTKIELQNVAFEPTVIDSTFIQLPMQSYDTVTISPLENGNLDINMIDSPNLANQMLVDLGIKHWDDLTGLSITIKRD